jgi:Mn2+/Fe2+ NRAMP family transporter
LSLGSFLKSFRPRIITGSAYDDPSSIATFAQAGAKFGLGLLWIVIFLYPSIFVIQEICGRIDLLTGSGLAVILGKKYSKRKVVLPIISLLIIAIR